MDDRTADNLFNRFAELLHASDARSDKRFDALDARIDRLDTRIDDVQAKLREFQAATESNYGRLVSRFAGLESRFAAFETRFTNFETKARDGGGIGRHSRLDQPRLSRRHGKPPAGCAQIRRTLCRLRDVTTPSQAP
jgi:hypothetical protein